MKRICCAAAELENSIDFKEKLEETLSLADACGFEVVEVTSQKRRSLHPATFFGQGKCEEISQIIVDKNCDGVLIASTISPSQMRALKEMWKCEVFDRNDLILEIFARRAQTRQAKLQVELAYLKHRLPYVIHTGQNFSRMGGSAGKSSKGEGEKQLELDKRKIETQIQNVSKELKDVLKNTKVMRKKRSRSDLKSVALVGYTNAGKSTCMNALLEISEQTLDKQVFAKDMLFATLDTTVRKISWNRYEFLLSDTVGFVSNLPKELMDAFHSTLEEAIEADLILLVLDESSPNCYEQLRITLDTLELLQIKDIPILYVHNKCDIAGFGTNDHDHVYISAQNKEGIDHLLEHIIDFLREDYVHIQCKIPYERGDLIALIQRQGQEINMNESDLGVEAGFDIHKNYKTLFEDFLV